MTHRSRQSAFTIVELMVTLAVAAILMGFAVPAFNDFVNQRTMTTRANDFVLALTYARSEAVRRGGLVSIQAVDGEDDNEWGGGYCVAIGGDECDGEVLRRFPPMDDQSTLDAVGAGWHSTLEITFNARGMMTAPQTPGAVQLCRDGEDRGRVVNVSVAGRTDVEELDCP